MHFLAMSLLAALSVKPAPLLSLRGDNLAVSPDGRTIWTSDGHRVWVYSESGQLRQEVKEGLGAGPGPLFAVSNNLAIVQAMQEKKKRFFAIENGAVWTVPFRVPKDQTIPALPIAYAHEAVALVGLQSPFSNLTDLLVWDFAQKPPLESPRTGISAYCWTIWAAKDWAK